MSSVVCGIGAQRCAPTNPRLIKCYQPSGNNVGEIKTWGKLIIHVGLSIVRPLVSSEYASNVCGGESTKESPPRASSVPARSDALYGGWRSTQGVMGTPGELG